jgi:hypothetical protein
MTTTNETKTEKIQSATILKLGEFIGETVIIFVNGKYMRHCRTFSDSAEYGNAHQDDTFGEWETGAFLLMERVEQARRVNLWHWRELDASEAQTLKEQGEEMLADDMAEQLRHTEALKMAGV